LALKGLRKGTSFTVRIRFQNRRQEILQRYWEKQDRGKGVITNGGYRGIWSSIWGKENMDLMLTVNG